MSAGERNSSIDELLDRAVIAINRGDRAAATALAEQVLAADSANLDAENLLTAPDDGEIRRLSILFADLADSTMLSTQVEPETYRLLVWRYREQVLATVKRFEGHVNSITGDGILAVFGHPAAHEDDIRRAVEAGLEVVREVDELSEAAHRRFGIRIAVRVGVHRGLVYLDTVQGDVYGLAANLAARVASLAEPRTLVISAAVEPLVRNVFQLSERPAAAVKGVNGLIAHYRVVAGIKAAAKSTRVPLVGRERELANLQRCWAGACTATLATAGLVFRGEPGIGKSRLVSVAAEMAEGAGAVVLEMAGSALHTDSGLYPVRAMLERHCDIARSTSPRDQLRQLENELSRLLLEPAHMVPLLAPVLGIGAEHGYQQVEAEGRRLFELIAAAVQQYVLACFGQGPGLLVVEDVHWFDPSTLGVLSALLESNEGRRLLVVVAGRPGAWLSEQWPIDVVDVGSLNAKETDALILALNPDVTDAERAAVNERCDGVPFYIEQVVAGLGEEGVPEGLYESLFVRLHASADVMPVVQAAAVIGREVDRGLLNATVELSESAINAAIETLEVALVLEPWGSDGWRFRHELLRELAYELAPPSVARSLHRRVADALAGGNSEWQLIAGHYEKAGQFDSAAAAYQLACADARRRGALAEARAYLSNAIHGLQGCPGGSDRDRREMSLRLERGFLTAAAEGPQHRAVVPDFERCLELGGTDLRDDEVVATLAALVGYYACRADLVRCTQVIEALRGVVSDGRAWFDAIVESCLGVVACFRGEYSTARVQLEKATAGWTAADNEMDAVWFMPADPVVTALLHLALTRVVQGDLVGVQTALADAAQLADQLGFPKGPYNQAYVRFIDTWICIETGEFEEAARRAASLIEFSQRHGFDPWELWGETLHAVANAVSADRTDLEAVFTHLANLTTLVDTLRTVELLLYVTVHDSFIGRLLIATGQHAQAATHVEMALQFAADSRMGLYDAELLRRRAQTQSEPAAIAADLRAARDVARQQGAPLFELRAALDDYQLRGEAARGALIDVCAHFAADSPLPELALARAVLAAADG